MNRHPRSNVSRTAGAFLLAIPASVAILFLLVFTLGSHNPFLAPLLGTALVTAVHAALTVWFARLLGRMRTEAVVGLLLSLLTTASCASWALAAWEEYRAQQSLPIINIAGIFAPIGMIALLILLWRLRSGARRSTEE